MYQFFAVKAIHRFVAVTLFLFSGADTILAAELTIEEAGRLALKDDYTLQAISSRSQSMSELSVAAESLPDPKLKLGFANLPTDTFNLGQEPMTQAVIGVQQMFPRGNTRALKSRDISTLKGTSEVQRHSLRLMIRYNKT